MEKLRIEITLLEQVIKEKIEEIKELNEYIGILQKENDKLQQNLEDNEDYYLKTLDEIKKLNDEIMEKEAMNLKLGILKALKEFKVIK